MSGHSKWHNIKRKKEVKDAQKGAEFTKLAKRITIAAREGGGDPDSNPTLRLAIDKAKQAKMPKDNIERAIQRGVGASTGEGYTQAIYEGFGPSGVAFMVYTLTDNSNRTVAELKTIFSKYGGSLGQPGSTAYIFIDKSKPLFYTTPDEHTYEKVENLLHALEEHDDVEEVYTNTEKI